jgi:hypothetical protein
MNTNIHADRMPGRISLKVICDAVRQCEAPHSEEASSSDLSIWSAKP